MPTNGGKFTAIPLVERPPFDLPLWRPTLVEICIGLEINGYLPAEF
jgi:hypothetical protein